MKIFLIILFLSAGTFLNAQTVAEGATGSTTAKPIIFELSACQAETIYFRTQTNDSAWYAEGADISIVEESFFHSVNNNVGKWKFSSLVEKVTDPTADTIAVQQFVLKTENAYKEKKFLYYFNGTESTTMYSVNGEVVPLSGLKQKHFFHLAKKHFDKTINTSL